MSTHRVTIVVPDPDCPEDIDYTVEHLEDVPRCKVWHPCKECSDWESKKLSARADQGLFDEVVYHGVGHQEIEGEWMVPSNECGLQWDAGEWVYDVYREFGAGVHPIEPEYWGDGLWFGYVPAEVEKS